MISASSPSTPICPAPSGLKRATTFSGSWAYSLLRATQAGEAVLAAAGLGAAPLGAGLAAGGAGEAAGKTGIAADAASAAAPRTRKKRLEFKDGLRESRLR